jgi:hypothetical protein
MNAAVVEWVTGFMNNQATDTLIRENLDTDNPEMA